MHSSYVKGATAGFRDGEIAARCHGYIISDKAMRVRMPHSELKWEILVFTFGGINLLKRCKNKSGGIFSMILAKEVAGYESAGYCM